MSQKGIINEYDKHLQQTIGVAENTRCQYTRYVLHFLSETGTDLFKERIGLIMYLPTCSASSLVSVLTLE